MLLRSPKGLLGSLLLDMMLSKVLLSLLQVVLAPASQASASLRLVQECGNNSDMSPRLLLLLVKGGKSLSPLELKNLEPGNL